MSQCDPRRSFAKLAWDVKRRLKPAIRGIGLSAHRFWLLRSNLRIRASRISMEQLNLEAYRRGRSSSRNLENIFPTTIII
jgi:hypothetical protein